MDKQSLKLGARILENMPPLPPDITQRWIESPWLLSQVLQNALWQNFGLMKVVIGEFPDAAAVLLRLAASAVKISDTACEALTLVEFEQSKREVSVVWVTAKELGFDESPLTEEFHKRAATRRLTLCPPEVSPLLLLQCADRLPVGAWYVAMQPISVRGFDMELRVERKPRGTLELLAHGFPGKPGLHTRYAFMKEKKKGR